MEPSPGQNLLAILLPPPPVHAGQRVAVGRQNGWLHSSRYREIVPTLRGSLDGNPLSFSGKVVQQRSIKRNEPITEGKLRFDNRPAVRRSRWVQHLIALLTSGNVSFIQEVHADLIEVIPDPVQMLSTHVLLLNLFSLLRHSGNYDQRGCIEEQPKCGDTLQSEMLLGVMRGIVSATSRLQEISQNVGIDRNAGERDGKFLQDSTDQSGQYPITVSPYGSFTRVWA